MGELYSDGETLDRNTCRETFELTSLDEFRLNQILHWANTNRVREGGAREETDLERIVTQGSVVRGITRLYTALANLSRPTHHAYEARWEQDIGEGIEEDVWGQIWARAAKTSICLQHKASAYKNHHEMVLYPGSHSCYGRGFRPLLEGM